MSTGDAGRARSGALVWVWSLPRVGPTPPRRVTPFLIHETASLLMLPLACCLGMFFARVGEALGWPAVAQRLFAVVGLVGAYHLTHRWLAARWLGRPWPPWGSAASEARRAAERRSGEPPDVRPG
jgi:hypothetical protein